MSHFETRWAYIPRKVMYDIDVPTKAAYTIRYKSRDAARYTKNNLKVVI